MAATVNASTSAGVVITPDNSGVLALQSSSTTALTIDASQNVGIGTSSPTEKLTVSGAVIATSIATSTARDGTIVDYQSGVASRFIAGRAGGNYGQWEAHVAGASGITKRYQIDYQSIHSWYAADGTTERARIASDGAFLIGKTAVDDTTQGFAYRASGYVSIVRNGGAPLSINRRTDDGELVELFQENVKEGTISVSGTTVSYNGGHLSRWAQTTAPKDDSLLKGTVLSNLDAMNVYTDADGNPVNNEQLNKVKVSDVEGDANVAGVFVNWSHDDAHNVDEINMAMTGDMIIRIAQGTTVARGDLLMSAGDGTAKPQGDDIVRSKTIAKVTSTHVTCTYADGSYCVPCVLMAC